MNDLPHVARMRTEKADLELKVRHLQAFLGNDAGPFKDMPALDQKLMEIQLASMQSYLLTLSTRICRAQAR